MKIGIMTFWWSQDNYGQILQCYALQKYLRDAGHEAFVIKYDRDKDYYRSKIRYMKILNPIFLIKYCIRKVNLLKEGKLVIKDRNFSTFKNKINFSEENYSSYKQLKNNCPIADVYIVGSDQVWNCFNLKKTFVKNVKRAFSLEFVPSNKKIISYAASFGSDDVLPCHKEYIKKQIEKFEYISVREYSGMQILKDLGVKKDVFVDPDPTFLVNVENYRELKKKPKFYNGEEFIFLYLLDNQYNFNFDYLTNFAKERKLKIYFVVGNQKKKQYPYDVVYPSIEEWLYMIDNAKYIITNSFHCSVFSTLFHKSFGVVKLADVDAKMNSRFSQLFDLLKIEERYINNDDYSILDKSYDCSIISLENAKIRFKDFINEL